MTKELTKNEKETIRGILAGMITQVEDSDYKFKLRIIKDKLSD